MSLYSIKVERFFDHKAENKCAFLLLNCFDICLENTILISRNAVGGNPGIIFDTHSCLENRNQNEGGTPTGEVHEGDIYTGSSNLNFFFVCVYITRRQQRSEYA